MARQIIDLPKANEVKGEDLLILRQMLKKKDTKMSLNQLAEHLFGGFQENLNAMLDIANPIGIVRTFYDNENHSNYLGFKWKEIEDYDIVAHAYVINETNIVSGKNIESITKFNSTYLVKFIKPMKDINYIPVVNGEASGIAQEIVGVLAKETTGFKFDFGNHAALPSYPVQTNIIVFGRLEKPESRKWRRIE